MSWNARKELVENAIGTAVGRTGILAMGAGALAAGGVAFNASDFTLAGFGGSNDQAKLENSGWGLLGTLALGTAAYLLRKPMARGIANLAGTKASDGVLKATGIIGAKFLGTAGRALKETEASFIRPLLTGKSMSTSALDAYLPYFRTKDYLDPMKYGLNPTVARRLTVAGMGFTAMSGMAHAVSPGSPTPSVYYDGTNMRHINDMGMDAKYAQDLLGMNSVLSATYKERAFAMMSR